MLLLQALLGITVDETNVEAETLLLHRTAFSETTTLSLTTIAALSLTTRPPTTTMMTTTCVIRTGLRTWMRTLMLALPISQMTSTTLPQRRSQMGAFL